MPSFKIIFVIINDRIRTYRLESTIFDLLKLVEPFFNMLIKF